MTVTPTHRPIDSSDAAHSARVRALAAGLADPAGTERVGPLLATKARILQARRGCDWLAQFAPEAVLQVSADPFNPPGRDHALVWDDLRRRAEGTRHLSGNAKVRSARCGLGALRPFPGCYSLLKVRDETVLR